jgi:hypothetical protein
VPLRRFPSQGRTGTLTGQKGGLDAQSQGVLQRPSGCSDLSKAAALFLSGHRDLGDRDRVTLHVARQRLVSKAA